MHKNIHKGTWRSPDGRIQTKSTIFASHEGGQHHCRTCEYTEEQTSQQITCLLVATVKIKLKNQAKKKVQKALDVQRLRIVEIQQHFQFELKTRFSSLDEQEPDDECRVEERWRTLKETITNTALEVAGFSPGSRKEQWITQTTWRAIDERKALKARTEQAINSGNNIAEISTAYQSKDKEVKSQCRADKQLWFDKNLAKAEKAAMHLDTKHCTGS
jgi:hypothetical protein